MAGASPTSLTLKYLREHGWLAQVVERWVPTRDPEESGLRLGMLDAIRLLRARAASDVIWSPTLISAAEELEAATPPEPQAGPPSSKRTCTPLQRLVSRWLL